MKPIYYLNYSKAKGKIVLSLQMVSSEMRVAVGVSYLQALVTNTGLNSSGQEYILSGRHKTCGSSLAKENFSVQNLMNEASAIYVQFSWNPRRVPHSCGIPAGSLATTPA